jgi:hypothetical protein
MMNRPVHLLLCAACGLLGASCGSLSKPAYHVTRHGGSELPRYPVARQGNLTAWLASDHVSPGGEWLYAPGEETPKYRIVGIIKATAMPEAVKHDGSFLVVAGYEGPIFPLWEGKEAQGWLFTGKAGWLGVRLHQGQVVNTWVAVAEPHRIGGWSGNPVVIGDPDHPDAVAGVMWYKSNVEPTLGGTTSTRMLKRWLGKLRLADFVKP